MTGCTSGDCDWKSQFMHYSVIVVSDCTKTTHSQSAAMVVFKQTKIYTYKPSIAIWCQWMWVWLIRCHCQLNFSVEYSWQPHSHVFQKNWEGLLDFVQSATFLQTMAEIVADKYVIIKWLDLHDFSCVHGKTWQGQGTTVQGNNIVGTG